MSQDDEKEVHLNTTNSIKSIVASLSEKLNQDEINEAMLLIDHSEYGVALEYIDYLIIEYDIEIAEKIRNELKLLSNHFRIEMDILK